MIELVPVNISGLDPMKIFFLFACLVLTACTNSLAEEQLLLANNESKLPILEKGLKQCCDKGICLQILGSGGPEIDDLRASSGYLIWVDGQSKILIDAGGGSAANFEKAGAKFEDLDMLLLTHLHVDHSADLPVYIKGSYFGSRNKNLPIIGPAGNRFMPATDVFVDKLFKQNEGAYQYLGDYLPNDDLRPAPYLLQAQVYSEALFNSDKSIKATAVSVNHGPIPALAWRLDIGNTSILFSGDMGSGGKDFTDLLNKADLFVAHNAIPETVKGSVINLHMRPTLIGEYANQAQVKALLLTHRMNRTLGVEDDTLLHIKKNYKKNISFANDLDCIQLTK